MPSIDNSLSKLRDNNESLFTILIYDTSKEEFISDLKKRLDKIKDISNTFKRKKLNDRVFKLLTQVENLNQETFNNIILVHEDLIFIDLTQTDIKMLREYSINKYTFEYGEYFNISWLKDLFENFTFNNIVIFNSNQYTHWVGNLYKRKKISQTSSQDYIKNLTTNFYLFGKINNFVQSKFTNKNLLEHNPNIINWTEIIQYIDRLKIKSNTKLLDDVLGKMSTESDKFIFGNDIYESIESYNVKEIYLHEQTKKQFYKLIEEKGLNDNINFNIILIDSFDTTKPDSSTNLLNNFSGIIGIKYY